MPAGPPAGRALAAVRSSPSLPVSCHIVTKELQQKVATIVQIYVVWDSDE